MTNNGDNMSKKNWIVTTQLEVNIQDGHADIRVPIEVQLSLRLTPEGDLQLVWDDVYKMDDSVDYYDGVYITLDHTLIATYMDD